jgi:hypothetical protein
MATDLVRWGNAPDGDGGRDKEEDEWDRPPTDPRSVWHPEPIHDGKSEYGARRADRDAFHAEARGDASFAATREGDAADLRQSRWDWGDARTWIWIAAMCVGFLLVGAFTYYMPQGRHNQNDGPTPTPTIRVY